MGILLYILEAFLAVFIVLTPFVGVSCFVALSDGLPGQPERNRAALRTSAAVAVIMLLFLFGGNYLFRLFGITLPAFQIAGGVVIFANGLAMVRAHTAAKFTDEEAREGAGKEDFTVVPLAVPMLCGPATISTVILYAAEARDGVRVAGLVVAVVAASASIYVLLRLSAQISRMLGIAGMNVLTRIMGLMLASLAVQIMLKGIAASYELIRSTPA